MDQTIIVVDLDRIVVDLDMIVVAFAVVLPLLLLQPASQFHY